MPIQRKGMRALQIWCARVTSGYASVEVVDLTSSFRSGLAFVGIIHHFRPDLIDDLVVIKVYVLACGIPCALLMLLGTIHI